MNTLQSQYHAASLIDALHASWTTSVSLSLWFSHTRQDWVSSQLNCCHFSLSNGLRHALIRSNARLTSSRCSFDLTFPPQQLQQRVATHMKTVKSDTWRHGSDLIHSNTKKKQKPWSLAVSVKSSTMRRRYWSHPWHFGKTKPKQIGGQVDAGWRSTASKNIENSRLCTKISKDVFGMMGPPLQLFQELGSKISQVTAFGDRKSVV